LEPQLVPTRVRIAIAVIFLSIGAADVALGATAGEIVGAVLAVPALVWIARTMRRRRPQG
jgi:uncharacterized MnhB-related membrane protein